MGRSNVFGAKMLASAGQTLGSTFLSEFFPDFTDCPMWVSTQFLAHVDFDEVRAFEPVECPSRYRRQCPVIEVTGFEGMEVLGGSVFVFQEIAGGVFHLSIVLNCCAMPIRSLFRLKEQQEEDSTKVQDRKHGDCDCITIWRYPKQRFCATRVEENCREEGRRQEERGHVNPPLDAVETVCIMPVYTRLLVGAALELLNALFQMGIDEVPPPTAQAVRGTKLFLVAAPNRSSRGRD